MNAKIRTREEQLGDVDQPRPPAGARLEAQHRLRGPEPMTFWAVGTYWKGAGLRQISSSFCGGGEGEGGERKINDGANCIFIIRLWSNATPRI